MQSANIPAVLLAIALSAACWAASGMIVAAQEPARATATEVRSEPVQAHPSGELWQVLGDWSDRFAATATKAWALLVAGYARAPALVLVLTAFLVLPAVALVSLVVQSTARRRAARSATHAAEVRAGIAEMAGQTAPGDAAPLWSQQAWLSLEDGSAGTLPLAGHLTCIGRHQDNDVRLPDTAVHRYHAVIEHTPDEAFVITDLSGEKGNGLRINGERLARAKLADGDVIELGRTRLKFESVQV